jgi:hypothetical protein
MMRVFKVTSPVSVGSWILAGYVPASGVAALCALSGRLPKIGAMAAGGLGLVAAPAAETTPARNLALIGAAMETAASERMEHRIGMVAEPYSEGRGGNCVKAGKVLAVLDAAGALLGRRSRAVSALSGAALTRRYRTSRDRGAAVRRRSDTGPG